MKPVVCESDLGERAARAYMRKCSREGAAALQPARKADCWRARDGQILIALANVNGLLAVYSARSANGRIAEVKDVPAELQRAYR